MRLFE
jgi:hypothetical protein